MFPGLGMDEEKREAISQAISIYINHIFDKFCGDMPENEQILMKQAVEILFTSFLVPPKLPTPLPGAEFDRFVRPASGYGVTEKGAYTMITNLHALLSECSHIAVTRRDPEKGSMLGVRFGFEGTDREDVELFAEQAADVVTMLQMHGVPINEDGRVIEPPSPEEIMKQFHSSPYGDMAPGAHVDAEFVDGPKYEQQIGTVGVDSGHLMITDPRYGLSTEGTCDVLSEMARAGRDEPIQFKGREPGDFPQGIAFGGFGGDGVYPVIARRDEPDGPIREIVIRFGGMIRRKKQHPAKVARTIRDEEA